MTAQSHDILIPVINELRFCQNAGTARAKGAGSTGFPVMGRWKEFPPGTEGSVPPPRSGHSLVCLDDDSLLLFGGGPDDNVSNDVYRFTLTPGGKACCELLHPDPQFAAPFERDRHSAWVWRGKMHIFGGEDVHGAMYSDVWCFDHNDRRWEEKQTAGALPAPRRGQTCTVVGDTVWLFGGLDAQRQSVSDVYSLDMLTNTFTLRQCTGRAPSGRRGHSATAVGRYLYVFGGCDNNELLLGDLWRLNLDTLEWEEVHPYAPSHGPEPSVGHAVAVYRNMLLLFGGNTSPTKRASSAEIWLWDVEKSGWSQLRMRKEPRARSYHSIVEQSKGNILVFGGWSGFSSMNDIIEIAVGGTGGSLKSFVAEYVLKHGIQYKTDQAAPSEREYPNHKDEAPLALQPPRLYLPTSRYCPFEIPTLTPPPSHPPLSIPQMLIVPNLSGGTTVAPQLPVIKSSY